MMSDSERKLALKDAQKEAMRAKDKDRLGVIRIMLSEIKRIEVDERIDVDDDRILLVLDKQLKQRRDSIAAFTDAGRDELAAKEQFEIEVIQSFLPQQLDAEEIAAIVSKAIADSGAAGMQDMGKVMGLVKPQVQGRADVGMVSGLVKKQLAG